MWYAGEDVPSCAVAPSREQTQALQNIQLMPTPRLQLPQVTIDPQWKTLGKHGKDGYFDAAKIKVDPWKVPPPPPGPGKKR